MEKPLQYLEPVTEQQLLQQLMELVQGAIELKDDPKVWAALLNMITVWRRQRLALDLANSRTKIEIKAPGKSRVEFGPTGKPTAIHADEGITLIMTPDGPALFSTLDELIASVENGVQPNDPSDDGG